MIEARRSAELRHYLSHLGPAGRGVDHSGETRPDRTLRSPAVKLPAHLTIYVVKMLSKQTSKAILSYENKEKCRGTDSNCRHRHFQCRALPPELPRQGLLLSNPSKCLSRRSDQGYRVLTESSVRESVTHTFAGIHGLLQPSSLGSQSGMDPRFRGYDGFATPGTLKRDCSGRDGVESDGHAR